MTLFWLTLGALLIPGAVVCTIAIGRVIEDWIGTATGGKS